MKKVAMAMIGFSLVLALGVFLLAPQAEAVSTVQIGEGVGTSGNGTISVFLGEDGAIWYTVTRVAGGASLTTGNSDNPFDKFASMGAPSATCVSAATCTGFVDKDFLSAACTLTGDTCSGIYVRTPGAGTFKDSPTVQHNTPISSGNANVIATGSDNNFWYTQFDNGNTGTAATMGPGNPGQDPFKATAESGNTAGAGDGNGFANATSLGVQCSALSRTCVGIWVRFP